MTLIVCPLHEVAEQLVRSRPARIVSLLSPDQDPPPAPAGMPRLVLRFHDIAEPREGLVAPDRAMIADLLAFGDAWDEQEPLLLHCWMGVSRSPAAALVFACALDPTRDEVEAAAALREASPIATPNPLMIALADDLLGREGRLIAAAAQIGRGVEAPHGNSFRLPVRPPQSRPAAARPFTSACSTTTAPMSAPAAGSKCPTPISASATAGRPPPTWPQGLRRSRRP